MFEACEHLLALDCRDGPVVDKYLPALSTQDDRVGEDSLEYSLDWAGARRMNRHMFSDQCMEITVDIRPAFIPLLPATLVCPLVSAGMPSCRRGIEFDWIDLDLGAVCHWVVLPPHAPHAPPPVSHTGEIPAACDINTTLHQPVSSSAPEQQRYRSRRRSSVARPCRSAPRAPLCRCARNARTRRWAEKWDDAGRMPV
jgi:hypothetical protein